MTTDAVRKLGMDPTGGDMRYSGIVLAAVLTLLSGCTLVPCKSSINGGKPLFSGTEQMQQNADETWTVNETPSVWSCKATDGFITYEKGKLKGPKLGSDDPLLKDWTVQFLVGAGNPTNH
jgi:hypothetical protein